MAPNRLRLLPIACMQVRGAWLPEAKYDPNGLAVVLEEQSVQARARVPLHHSPGESHTDRISDCISDCISLHLIASRMVPSPVPSFVTCSVFRHLPRVPAPPSDAPPEGDALIASDEL